jgi:hypothetical protein
VIAAGGERGATSGGRSGGGAAPGVVLTVPGTGATVRGTRATARLGAERKGRLGNGLEDTVRIFCAVSSETSGWQMRVAWTLSGSRLVHRERRR